MSSIFALGRGLLAVGRTWDDGTVRISVLGPVELSVAGRSVAISGARLRRLLVRLAVADGRPVSAGELTAAVWLDERPNDETNALQTLISRLRRVLGDDAEIQQTPGGYRLSAARSTVAGPPSSMRTDLAELDALSDSGRRSQAAGDLDSAIEDYRAAAALFRGEALADAGEADYAQPLRSRLDERRLEVVHSRIECELAAGRAATAVPDLEALVADYPLREQFTAQLMTALTSTGRANEALVVFDRTRRRLAEELGSHPGADLRQAHQRALHAATPAGPEVATTPRRTNLRAVLTSFLGREDELKRVSSLLEAGRLATVVGPGGAGKTRLAGVVATEWADALEDGVWFVELAPVTDPVNLAQAVLASLGLRANQLLDRSTVDTQRVSTTDRLLDVLSQSDCLLVVDNCEHLILAVAELVDLLLANCPRLRVLATSREPLGIDGEALCMLPPLTLPAVEAGVQEAIAHSSVQLFADRAGAVSAGFEITQANVADVVEIVRRLDGLPLAIELAAARLRVLPVTEIRARLSDRFRLLSGGSRVAMPRHRTLRAVVEWSWELLTDSERLLAERLAVFPSGATLTSATAICADGRLDRADIGELLSALVDKSLLRVDPDSDLRYRMLETLREYGVERLSERGEVGDARLAHARYFAQLVAEAEPWLRTSEQLEWLRLLEREQDNLLAALRYLGESGDTRRTLRMVGSLGWYWILLGSHSEAVSWLSFALDVPDGVGGPDAGSDESGGRDNAARTVIEAQLALNTMATSFGEGHETDVAASLNRMEDLGRRLGEIPAEDPMVLLLRPMMSFFSGDSERIVALLDEAMSSSDDWIRGAALMFRANLRENDGEVEKMRADVDAALGIFRQIGDRWGMASTLTSLAQLHTLDGDLPAAIAEYTRAAGYLADFGAHSDEAMLHLRLTDLQLRLGDFEAAHREAELVRTTDFQAGSSAQRVLAECALSAVASATQDHPAMTAHRRNLLREVSGMSPVHPMNGHVRSLALASLAGLETAGGDYTEAAAHLRESYDCGVATQDMPIMAAVAVAVATWAAALGDPAAWRHSAEILGAAAQLRGSDDRTDWFVRRLRERLTEQLGAEQLAACYGRGRALTRKAALARIDPATVPR
ncbi:winged helix-turn-helix domain-containing protein [Jatrophihabitans telluris]|uniref:Winged helix-turn-helix domain-containing protein n=1 Tax=Jatrophihabitans telluris TaxID=2038343 RepID=A0ABY4R1E5_9ACTN|nr:BTAD domain-containing putative transcriptional regulator [Jatrophihabitans telluris]UQX89600.1 winged helix-turn-helix domain-containing protein [Jatrophihabitans telluris]